MTRLYVPACGDRLKLIEPWTFTLYFEHRNFAFAKEQKIILEDTPGFSRWGRSKGWEAYTMPMGTVLECDRVYIRTFSKNASSVEDDYDSITWKIIGENGKQKKNCRFWAKLSDCNQIMFEIPSDANYKERAKAEAIVEAAKPKRINIDEISSLIYSARQHNRGSELGLLFQKATADALVHFAESKRRDQEAYGAYVRACKEEKKMYDGYQRDPVFMPFSVNRKIVEYNELTNDAFLNALFSGNISCKFSRRSDGTCCRQMIHPVVVTDRYYCYSRHNREDAVSGLSYSIITDKDDQKIIDVEVCKERKEK